MTETLSQNARIVLSRLQSVRGNALYVIPSFVSPDDRIALAELEAVGLVQLCDVPSGIISRKQARLTDVARANPVVDPWEHGAFA